MPGKRSEPTDLSESDDDIGEEEPVSMADASIDRPDREADLHPSLSMPLLPLYLAG